MSVDDEDARMFELTTRLSPEDGWEMRIADTLEKELRRRRVSYDWLATQLAAHGGPIVTALQLGELIHRGKMSSRLLLQILDALGADSLDLRAFYTDFRDKGEGEV